MIAYLRRAVEARTARRLAAVSYCEGCAQPVCTAACRAEAAVTRAHDSAAYAGLRII
jgi:Fe-S-cluster-containing dehydrogenase component